MPLYIILRLDFTIPSSADLTEVRRRHDQKSLPLIWRSGPFKVSVVNGCPGERGGWRLHMPFLKVVFFLRKKTVHCVKRSLQTTIAPFQS